MKINKKISLYALTCVISLLTAVFAFAATTQLAYDDGSAESGREFDSPYEYKAVFFDISSPVKLVYVDTYWTDNTGYPGTQKYKFWVYDKNKNLVYSHDWINNPSSSPQWNSHDVSGSNIMLNDDFYVVVNAPVDTGSHCVWWSWGSCWWSEENDEMDLGLDTNNPIKTNSYYYSGSSFYNYNSGNHMIRVKVNPIVNNPPILGSISDSPDPVLSGSLGGVVNIAANNVADAEHNILQMVCSYDATPAIDNPGCSNYLQNSNFPYTIGCNLPSDSNNIDDTVYCRLYDGRDYSNTKTTQSRDDGLPPDVSIILGDAPAEDDIYSGSLTVYSTLASSDASGITNCEIEWIKDAGFENIIPPSTTSLSYTYSSDNNYLVTYKCRDNVGLETLSSDSIIVDTIDPIPGDLTIVDQPWDTDGIVELSWTDATDVNGISKYEIYRDDVLIATVSAVTTTYTNSGLLETKIEDPSYTWYVKAYDIVGNSAETNKESTRVDTKAPKTQIISPLGGSYTNSKDVTVTAEYLNENIVTCQIRLDGESWITEMDGDGVSNEGTATYTFEGLADGSHIFEVKCIDQAGLTSSDSTTIFVDTVAPDVTIELGDRKDNPSDYDNDGMVWAMLTNDDADPSSGYTCEIKWHDEYKPIPISKLDQARFFENDGDKTVYYRCTDKAGNTGETSDTILIDRVYPVSFATVTSGSACSDWYNTDVEITLSATDDSSGVDKIRYSLSGEFGTFKDYTSPIIISNEGETTVYFFAKDKAGNKEAPPLNEITVKVDKTNPESDIISPVDTEHFANPSISFTGSATDSGYYEGTGSGVKQVELQIEKVSDGSVVMPWTVVEGAELWNYLWTSTQSLEYRAKTRATDNACNTEDTFVMTFTVQDDYDYRYYTKEEIDIMIEDLNSDITELRESQDATQEELDALEARLDSILDIIDGRLTDLESRQDVTEAEIAVMNARVSIIEMQIVSIFDDIDGIRNRLRKISGRVSALEEKTDYLLTRIDEMADFGMKYDQVDKTLKIDGSGAPAEANWAKIVIKTVDGNSVTKKAVPVDKDGKFSHTFDVSEWPYEGMNIYVKFYEDREWVMDEGQGWHLQYLGHIKTIADTWDGLVNELDYGFNLIDEKYFTTYYMNTPITREIVYSVKPHVDGEEEEMFDSGLYTIRLSQLESNTEEDISQTIEECIWLEADMPNELISSLTINTPGIYYVKLEATKGCYEEDGESSEYLESNRFVITVEDLKYSMPETTLTIVSPEPNKEDTYWTRSDNAFVLTGSAFLNGASVDSLYCTAIDTTSNTHFYTPVFWVTETYGVEGEVQERDYAQCSGIIIPSDMKFGVLGSGAEGVYSVFLDMDIEDAIDPHDTISIGIDDTSPVIGTIFPGEEDIISGLFTFTAEVTDELSGVRKVDLSLIMKGEEKPKWTTPATYNEETGLWEVDLDTKNTNELPDGSYDFRVEALDYAGNYVELTIDPMVDNTPPEMSEPQIGATVCIENHNLVLSVKAIDVTSGVDVATVEAVVTGPGVTGEVVTLSGGDVYTGTLTNENIVAGTYDVVFYASDKAGNPQSTLTTQAVEMVSCPAPAPTGSSGGGGSGGSRKVTFTCKYDCGTWSDCANSKQTRTCTPNQYCEENDQNKPETEKTCSTGESTSSNSNNNIEETTLTESEQGNQPTQETANQNGNPVTGRAVTQPTGFGAHPWLAGILATAIIGGLGIFVYAKFLKR